MVHQKWVASLKAIETGFLVIVLLLFVYPAFADPDNRTKNTVPYVLTISGGVSLGAYEAGLNWALINYFKTEKYKSQNGTNSVMPRLSTVTGASAGSINGLLSAIAWCVDDRKITGTSTYQGSVSNNLFKEIWVDVGLDGLLPEDSSQYKSTDGLLSRRPFDTPLEKIRTIVTENIFQANCEIPLGITVTSEAPRTIEISGITVNNQRHFIPVILKTSAQAQAGFYSRPVDETNANYGNVIYLPPRADYTTDQKNAYPVNLDDVIQSVLASSAFPIAFGRVKLDYCAPRQIQSKNNVTPKTNHFCPKPYTAQTSVFVDGGVFDNVPLGSAMALAEENMNGAYRRLNYIFMDPDNRRHLKSASTAPSPDTTPQPTASDPASINYDLLEQLRFLGGAVLTARNYELYKVLTSGDWTNQTFHHAGLLTQAIERYADQHTIPLEDVATADCAILFETLAQSPQQALTAKWLSDTRYCINKTSTQLDYDYQYATADGAHFRKQRQALISNLANVAKAINNDRVYRQIQRIQHDPLGDRRILLSSRFFPLTGSYLGAFGAFFDRPFREIDYYTGVYDGIIDIASYACQFRRTNGNNTLCSTGKLARQLFNDFNIANDPNAQYLFNHIARLEHPEYSDKTSDWHWLTTLDADTGNKQMKVLFNALNNEFDDKHILQAPAFDEFIATLEQNNYTSDKSSDYFKYITKKDKDWWVLPSIRVTDRLYNLEVDADKESEKKSLLKQPLALVSYVAHHLDEGGKVITFEQPSTAPSTSFLRFLPYEIGMRANHDRTPYIAWEPVLNILGKELLHIKLTPFQPDTKDDNAKALYQASAIYNFFEHPYFTTGAGIDINGSWRERPGYDRATLGLSINTEIKKKVRLTFGVYDLYDHFAEYNFYLNVGLTDIAGYFH